MARNNGVRKRTSKKANKRKRRRRKLLILMVEFLLLIVAVGFVFIYTKFSKLQRMDVNIVANDALDEETLNIMSGYTSIAIFGVDARDNNKLGKGTLADMNIICNINKSTGEIRLVSVFRDSYLDIAGDGTFNKLNSAYSKGGPEQAINTINRNLDMNINDFVTVNWKAVAEAINILGGVDIEVTDREFRDINGLITETVEATGVPSVHLPAPGMHHMDGVQAVAYSRLRLMDTDYRRTERQRHVIGLVLQKAKSADLGTLNQLIDTVFPNVMTSLDYAEILNLAKDITKYDIGTTSGFPYDKQPQNMGKSLGECVIPLGLTRNVTQLHSFLYDREGYGGSSQVHRIDQQIKEKTGLGDPGTATTAVPQTQAPTAPPATQATAPPPVETAPVTEPVTETEAPTIPETEAPSTEVTETAPEIIETTETPTTPSEIETEPSSPSLPETSAPTEAPASDAVPVTPEIDSESIQ